MQLKQHKIVTLAENGLKQTIINHLIFALQSALSRDSNLKGIKQNPNVYIIYSRNLITVPQFGYAIAHQPFFPEDEPPSNARHCLNCLSNVRKCLPPPYLWDFQNNFRVKMSPCSFTPYLLPCYVDLFVNLLFAMPSDVIFERCYSTKSMK